MPPKQIMFKAMIYPHPKGQITLHLPQAQAWKTFQPITIRLLFPLQQGAAAVLKGTHHTSHPGIAVAHATLWPMDAYITACTMTTQQA